MCTSFLKKEMAMTRLSNLSIQFQEELENLGDDLILRHIDCDLYSILSEYRKIIENESKKSSIFQCFQLARKFMQLPV